MYGQIVQDAVFDLLETIVIMIQHFLGTANIDIILGFRVPWQVQQPVHIVADDTGLGIHVAHTIEPVQFLLDGFLHVFRIVALSNPLTAFLNLFGLAFFLAQFLTDGLDLLTEIVLLLDLVHLFTDLPANLLFKLEDLEFPGQDFIEFFQAGLDIDCSQDFLTRFQLEVQMTGN